MTKKLMVWYLNQIKPVKNNIHTTPSVDSVWLYAAAQHSSICISIRLQLPARGCCLWPNPISKFHPYPTFSSEPLWNGTTLQDPHTSSAMLWQDFFCPGFNITPFTIFLMDTEKAFNCARNSLTTSCYQPSHQIRKNTASLPAVNISG